MPSKPKGVKGGKGKASLVSAALVALKDTTGTSLSAIKKFLTATYGLPASVVGPVLKKLMGSGAVTKVRAAR